MESKNELSPPLAAPEIQAGKDPRGNVPDCFFCNEAWFDRTGGNIIPWREEFSGVKYKKHIERTHGDEFLTKDEQTPDLIPIYNETFINIRR